MINLQNVLENFISQRLPMSLTSTTGLKDEEMTAILFENL